MLIEHPMLSASGNLVKCQEEVLYLQPLNTLAWQIMKLYSILVYILLFTQAPIPVCLDGTIIDSRTLLVTTYYCGYVGV